MIRNSRWPLQSVLMNRIWITSWQGKEGLRARIQAVAREVYADDLTVREKYPSSVATGLICGAMRDPSSSSRRPLLRMLLFELHNKCVVRSEWESILDLV